LAIAGMIQIRPETFDDSARTTLETWLREQAVK
jgi:hypothetical protein